MARQTDHVVPIVSIRRSWNTVHECLVILAFALAGKPSFAMQADSPSAASRVDQLFVTWDRPNSPGLAVGVIRNGQFQYKRGFGMANLEHGIPWSPRTVSRIGSLAKQFTAIAVLLLVRDGQLSLETDVRRLVPELVPYDTAITVRNLLHHTSGIRDFGALAQLAGHRRVDFLSREDVAGLLARQQTLAFPPGAEHSYSDSGYWLLGAIVERISGLSLREFAERKIFAPLGMTDTRFVDSLDEITPNRAQGYVDDDSAGFRIARVRASVVGDAGIVTTIEDLMGWDANFRHPVVGDGSVIDMMHRTDKLPDSVDVPYAAGLRIGYYRGLRTISHSGSNFGFRAFGIRFPDQDLSIYLLANLRSVPVADLANQVADIYLEAAFPIEPATKRDPVTQAPGPHGVYSQVADAGLQRYPGVYAWSGAGYTLDIEVKVERAQLHLNYAESGEWSQLAARNDSVFEIVDFPFASNIRTVSFEQSSTARYLEFDGEGLAPRPRIFYRRSDLGPTSRIHYLGRYYSAELDAVYVVEEEGDNLFVWVERPRQQLAGPLIGTAVEDLLLNGVGTFRFIRHDDDTVDGMSLDANRVGRLWFTRLGAQPAGE